MAYDFGSQTLGIKNPFKFEGLIKTVSGIAVALFALYPLFMISEALQTDRVLGWGYAILGLFLLGVGLKQASVGLYQLFRYFVGRSVPSSLSFNHSKSEQDVAQEEKRSKSLLYTDEQLHSMLMGRKNTTFIEPTGWIGRLVHSLMPKLTFLPYPMRNLAQELALMAINAITALIAFGFAAFVIGTGLAGESAKIVAMPVLSIVLLMYLMVSWRRMASAVQGKKTGRMKKGGGISFAGLIGLAIAVPMLTGYYVDSVVGKDIDKLKELAETYPLFSAWGNMAILLVVAAIVLGSIIPLMMKRMKSADPKTDVSEYRENMQESVHPDEIFINIENIVLANRRYKEIPNRVYRNFDPKLNEQSDGKGSFNGELIIETQPELVQGSQEEHSLLKKVLTVVSQIMFVGSAAILFFMAMSGIELASQVYATEGKYIDKNLVEFIDEINGLLVMFFAMLTIGSASKVLTTASHLFWGELQFNSLLMFMKTEGTFTESRISTGMAIHDSTRSENTVVRSSITPWIITSRLNTSVFATSGVNNLESIRYILGMEKNDQEMDSIVNEIKDFLKGREAIASITNEKDLGNASQVFSLNQQTRAASGNNEPADPNSLLENNQNVVDSNKSDEEAAGYLRDPSRNEEQ